MMSGKQIKMQAQKLFSLSLTKEGKLDKQKIKKLLEIVKANREADIGITIEITAKVMFLKQYLHLLKNAIIEDSLSITTSYPIPLENLSSFIEAYDKSYPQTIEDRSIIGGAIIQSGWNIIDMSIQHTLHTLLS